MFESFKNKNWRLYFFSQIFALLGTTVQVVAISWLAYQVTDSPIYLGIVVALQFLPMLIFGVFAGHFLDKYSKYKTLQYLQILQVLSPLLLCIWIYMGHVNIWTLIVASGLFGIIRVFDATLRHSLLSYIVAKDQVKNAYSLYASASNIARVLGPLLGGLMLIWVSTFWIFLFTCIMYMFVIVLYSQMNTTAFVIHKDNKNTDSNLLDSLNYIYRNETMRDLVFIGLFLGIFFWSFTTYFPIMVKTIFNNGALSFAALMTSYALGSLFGNLYSASHKDMSYKHLKKILIAFSIISILFAFSTYYAITIVLTLVSGFFVAQLNVITQSLVRINSEDKYLGTVMSMWLVITVGTTALGSIYYGYMSDWFGVQIALLIPVLLLLAFSLFYFKERVK